MKIEKLPRFMREGAAMAVLVLIGAGAWQSIPSSRAVFDPVRVVTDQFFTRERHERLIPPQIENGEIFGGGVTLRPGGAMEFELAHWEGVLLCHFQATAAAGATIEVLAVDATHTFLITRRQLTPQASQADGQPFVMLVDPTALPNLRRLLVRVAADSAGSVQWTEIRLAKKEELTVQQTAPFRVLVYEGLYAPLGEDHAVYVHAPANLSLVIPPGSRQLSTAFGFNPSVLARTDSASDGLGFEMTLETPGAAKTHLFHQLVEPGLRPTDRELQHTSVNLENVTPSILRLTVDPGPRGNIAWDSAVWRNFTVEERVGH